MSRNIKILIGILIVALLSIPIGIVAIDKSIPMDKIYQGVNINGTDVGLLTKDEAKKVLEDKYNSKLLNKKIDIKYKDFSYVINYKDLNAHYEIDKAVTEAMNYGKEGNAFSRFFKRFIVKNKPINIELQFAADDSKVSDDVKKIAKEINKAPKNAKLSFNGGDFNVTKEQDGLKVNEEKLTAEIKADINPKDQKEEIEVPVEVDKPKVTSETLSTINTKLAGFSTTFRAGNTNRDANLKVGANAINGTVVMPGEVFSANKTLGKRVASNGYKEAPVIVNGTLTPGLGGGICQVSTTLYNAVLLANLDIVERRPHSLRVGYVPASRDAAISGDYIDFKFKNTTKYPIYIEGYVSGNSISMNIYGSNKVPKTRVELSSNVIETLPAKTSGGKPQTRSQAFRKTYDENGKLIRDEKLSTDLYKG